MGEEEQEKEEISKAIVGLLMGARSVISAPTEDGAREIAKRVADTFIEEMEGR